MCGISGFTWNDEIKIKEMSEATAHRGPDATGFFCEEGISFGHNRLAIIDLSEEANQPMQDGSGRFTTVFNGEIYNFEDLKKELDGYDFKTKSDTEVILAGYATWGKDVVQKLNGIFAFAIWDRQTKELFCARDHMGIKPFFYFYDGKRFIFASEIKALLTHDIPRKLNREAFSYYMRVNYVPAPLTLIEGIHKLPQGHFLSIMNEVLTVSPYDTQSFTESSLSYEDAKKEVYKQVTEAVKRQLVADVPVGVYLSGGIDSSVVLSAMKQFQKHIKTFSVGFLLENENDEKKFNADFDLAQKTADFYDVEHHPLLMKADDVLELLQKAIHQNDLPISNPTSIAMMYLARHTKKEVTVVLSGNGGDELFGGYERYRLALFAQYYRLIPKFFRSMLSCISQLRKLDFRTPVDLYARFMFEKDAKISKIIHPTFFVSDSGIKQWFSKQYISGARSDLVTLCMETDRQSWLPNQALELGDSMSMSGSLEERVPFLDKELLHFARTLPQEYLVTVFSTKKILKDAFAPELPPWLLHQPKRGWMAPGAKWLRDPAIAEFVRNTLQKEYYAGTADLFLWSDLQTMLDDHIEKREYNLTLLWAVFTFQAWAKEYSIVV